MEYDYQSNDTYIITNFTEKLGDDFVAEFVADRSFLSKNTECGI